MAGKSRSDDDDIIVDINVTPLVDVVLVLLIIFMVTAQLMIPPSIPLELPKASTGVDTRKDMSLSITLSYAPKGQPNPLFLNGKKIAFALLVTKIQQAVKKRKKDVQVIIAADRRVIHGKVMSLLDMLRRQGIEQYAFNIDPGTSDLLK